MNNLKYLLSIFLLIIPQYFFAQNQLKEIYNQKIIDYKKQIKKYWNTNLDSANFLSDKAILYCDSLGLEHEKINFYKMKAISFYYKGDFKTTDSILIFSLKTAQQTNQNKIKADIYNLLSLTKSHRNQYDSAFYYGNKSLLLRKQLKLWKDVGGSYDNLGNIYQNIGDYKKAIEYNKKAIDIFKQYHFENELNAAYSNLSNIYGSINEYDKSLEYLLITLDYNKKKKDIYSLANNYYNLGFNYKEQNQPEQAITYFKLSNKYYKKINKLDALGDVKGMLGEIYLTQGKYKKAENLLLKAEYYYDKSGIPDYKAESQLNLAVTYLFLHKPKLAKQYMKKARKVLLNSTNLLLKIKLYETEIQYFNKLKKYKQSVETNEKLMAIKDSLHTLNTQDAINKQLLQFKLDKIKAENKLLKQKQIISNLRNRNIKLFSIGMSVLFLVSLLTLYLFFQKRKREKQITALKIKESELKKHELETTIKANSRQLTAFTLHMMQKNLILKDLLENVKTLEKEKKEKIGQKLKGFRIKLLNAISSDQDWKTFEIYFEKVNPNFLKRLKEKHPGITQKDLKLSALIRLNMDIKEAASALNVEPNTIRMARYRLRKKLNLESDDSLYDYMMNI